MAPRVIISVTNDLGNDQRVHRVATTLMEMGFEVCLVGRLRRSSKPLDARPYATKRIRYYIESGKFFYLAYAVRMFWWLLFQRVDVLLANDMDTLLPNFLVAKLRRKKLVYDSHEYWTEIPELIERPLTRSIWLWLERRLFPRVDAAYTVNESIAKIYREAYRVPVGVVRNLPFRQVSTEVAGPKERLLIYQGALNIGRGIELMIEAMRYLPDYKLLIAGVGDIADPLQKLANARPYKAQITFTGFLPPAQLRAHTRRAMLGLSLEADRGASYRLALPNKLFDYIQAGVPVIVSDLPEMAAVVQQHGVGEVLAASARKPESLAAQIKALCEDIEKYEAMVVACREAAVELVWENEQVALQALFTPFLH
jgi:glycosyltransferase involved in cell wall biosynthesis